MYQNDGCLGNPRTGDSGSVQANKEFRAVGHSSRVSIRAALRVERDHLWLVHSRDVDLMWIFLIIARSGILGKLSIQLRGWGA